MTSVQTFVQSFGNVDINHEKINCLSLVRRSLWFWIPTSKYFFEEKKQQGSISPAYLYEQLLRAQILCCSISPCNQFYINLLITLSTKICPNWQQLSCFESISPTFQNYMLKLQRRCWCNSMPEILCTKRFVTTC